MRLCLFLTGVWLPLIPSSRYTFHACSALACLLCSFRIPWILSKFPTSRYTFHAFHAFHAFHDCSFHVSKFPTSRYTFHAFHASRYTFHIPSTALGCLLLPLKVCLGLVRRGNGCILFYNDEKIDFHPDTSGLVKVGKIQWIDAPNDGYFLRLDGHFIAWVFLPLYLTHFQY